MQMWYLDYQEGDIEGLMNFGHEGLCFRPMIAEQQDELKVWFAAAPSPPWVSGLRVNLASNARPCCWG